MQSSVLQQAKYCVREFVLCVRVQVVCEGPCNDDFFAATSKTLQQANECTQKSTVCHDKLNTAVHTLKRAPTYTQKSPA